MVFPSLKTVVIGARLCMFVVCAGVIAMIFGFGRVAQLQTHQSADGVAKHVLPEVSAVPCNVPPAPSFKLDATIVSDQPSQELAKLATTLPKGFEPGYRPYRITITVSDSLNDK